MIRLLIAFCCIVAATAASGQDTLFLSNGRVLVGRVKVERRLGVAYYVVMRRGFDRHINASSVDRVVYSDHPLKRLLRPQFVRRSDRNIISLNAPNYCYVGTFPGVSVGMEYQRFLDKEGKFAVSLGAHYYWAGTASAGKLYRETRANLKGAFFEPGFSYHPAGNAGHVDPSIGISIALGTLRRFDLTDVGTSTLAYTNYGSHSLVAFLLQGEACFHNFRHYVFTHYGSCGPMIPAGVTQGLTGLIGFKFGGRF